MQTYLFKGTRKAYGLVFMSYPFPLDRIPRVFISHYYSLSLPSIPLRRDHIRGLPPSILASPLCLQSSIPGDFSTKERKEKSSCACGSLHGEKGPSRSRVYYGPCWRRRWRWWSKTQGELERKWMRATKESFLTWEGLLMQMRLTGGERGTSFLIYDAWGSKIDVTWKLWPSRRQGYHSS